MDRDAFRAAERDLWGSVGISPTEQIVDLPTGGTTVRVQEIGAGEPVVFIHGTSVSGSTWFPLVERLRDHRCLVVDRPGCRLSEPVGGRLDRMAFEEHADGFVSDLLGAIAAPVRMVWGERDVMGGEDVARAFAAQVPGAELCMVPGGHAPWLDDPDGVAALVGEFLAA